MVVRCSLIFFILIAVSVEYKWRGEVFLYIVDENVNCCIILEGNLVDVVISNVFIFYDFNVIFGYIFKILEFREIFV